MNRMTRLTGLLIGLTLMGSKVMAEGEVVRSELAKPLQASQELIKAKKYKEALDQLHEADAVASKTPYETAVIEQIRLVASTSGGEGAVAAKAFETLAATGRLSPTDTQRYERAVASTFYQTKDYANAALWGKRYQADGGQDGDVITLIGQSSYLAGDYGATVKYLQDRLKGNDSLTESQLQILGSSYLKLGDNANYTKTLELLVTEYPKEAYWADLIHRVETRPGFADRLSLDIGRLEQSVGQFNAPEKYVDQAELAIQAVLPGEAKAVLDQGFAKGILGKGADADRHQRLKNLAQTSAAKDLAELPQAETEADAAKDGNGLVNVGLDYLVNGQADKAVQLIQKGIEKGGLKHPDDARLHLGIALLRTGQKAKAIEAFHAVQGTDGTADIARLWVAQANKG